MRAILVVLLAAGLAACVTASNTLSTDQVESFGYAGVKVTFAPNAVIGWGDGERAYAASKGLPATESDAVAKTPEGQAYLRSAIASRLKASADRYFTSTMTGTRPVRFEIVVTNVTIASGIQRVVIGGHHNMTADTTVVDAKTGAVLLPIRDSAPPRWPGRDLRVSSSTRRCSPTRSTGWSTITWVSMRAGSCGVTLRLSRTGDAARFPGYRPAPLGV